MQRGITGSTGEPMPPSPCGRCGGRLVRSHREYRGRGSSADVLRCLSCGTTLATAARPDASRQRLQQGRQSRHAPVDEGPPSNPVLDPELARRLLEDLQL